jgi:8-oxo-dGTP pyrophosphatase MutT (NUDIX family)
MDVIKNFLRHFNVNNTENHLKSNPNSFPNVFYLEEELQPHLTPSFQPRPCFSSDELIQEFDNIIEHLRKARYIEFPISYVKSNKPLCVFLDVLRTLGSIDVSENEKSVAVRVSSEFAANFNKTFLIHLKEGFKIFDNWHSNRPIEDKIIGLQLLRYAEERRIEQSKKAGIFPYIYRIRPVAFAVIKAKMDGKDVYLFELNKDWHKFNLCGGKQEEVDAGDYKETILRELSEELGISKKEIRVTPLTKQEINSYGLVGNYGVLTKYPTMLYHAQFLRVFKLTPKLKWFTLEEFKVGRGKRGEEFMVPPRVRAFLFNELEGGLEKLPYSFPAPLQTRSRLLNVVRFIKLYYKVIAGILTILSALIYLLRSMGFLR